MLKNKQKLGAIPFVTSTSGKKLPNSDIFDKNSLIESNYNFVISEATTTKNELLNKHRSELIFEKNK